MCSKSTVQQLMGSTVKPNSIAEQFDIIIISNIKVCFSPILRIIIIFMIISINLFFPYVFA